MRETGGRFSRERVQVFGKNDNYKNNSNDRSRSLRDDNKKSKGKSEIQGSFTAFRMTT